VPSPDVLALLAVAVIAGALVQGSVGLGLALVAAPVTMLVEPGLMPGLLVFLASGYPVLTLAREWRDADWRGLAWAFSGRLPATALGAWIVSIAPARALGALVGVMVLVTVVLTVRLVRLPLRGSTLVAAGVLGGITGTATSIGGPPLALIYQHESGPRVRATLAAFFLGGGLLSLTGLAVVGELRAEQATTALTLAPCLVLGFALSTILQRHVDAGRTRAAVLAVCTASALTLIVRSLLA
jgi:uncharacterized protein